MGIHYLVALAVVTIRVSPLVIVGTSDVTRVGSTVVSILEAGTQSQIGTDGMTHAQSELPRGIELELVRVVGHINGVLLVR